MPLTVSLGRKNTFNRRRPDVFMWPRSLSELFWGKDLDRAKGSTFAVTLPVGLNPDERRDDSSDPRIELNSPSIIPNAASSRLVNERRSLAMDYCSLQDSGPLDGANPYALLYLTRYRQSG